MMSCHEAELTISRRVDGDLSRELDERLLEHLEACDSCQALAREEEIRSRGLRRRLTVPRPHLDQLEREILSRASREESRATVSRLGHFPALAAAVILIGVGVWSLGPWLGGPRDRPGGGPPRSLHGEVIHIYHDSQEMSPFPGSGRGRFLLETTRRRSFLSDADDLILELERVDSEPIPVKYTSDSWY